MFENQRSGKWRDCSEVETPASTHLHNIPPQLNRNTTATVVTLLPYPQPSQHIMFEHILIQQESPNATWILLLFVNGKRDGLHLLLLVRPSVVICLCAVRTIGVSGPRLRPLTFVPDRQPPDAAWTGVYTSPVWTLTHAVPWMEQRWCPACEQMLIRCDLRVITWNPKIAESSFKPGSHNLCKQHENAVLKAKCGNFKLKYGLCHE